MKMKRFKKQNLIIKKKKDCKEKKYKKKTIK